MLSHIINYTIPLYLEMRQTSTSLFTLHPSPFTQTPKRPECRSATKRDNLYPRCQTQPIPYPKVTKGPNVDMQQNNLGDSLSLMKNPSITFIFTSTFAFQDVFNEPKV